jgi:EFR3 protein
MSEGGSSARERRESFFARPALPAHSGTPRSSMHVEYTEEENSIFALKNLKQICELNNAALLRIGLDTLMDKLSCLDATNSTDSYPVWAVKLVSLVLTWLPIQHRYQALLASLEDLDLSVRQTTIIRTPKQDLILTIIEGILTTERSLIGLNVIDVLNSLISKLASQITYPSSPSQPTQKLIHSIIGLSRHIYYSDQIRDMCAAITEWSRPLCQSFGPREGKSSPVEDGDAETVTFAATVSLSILRAVLAQGGNTVSLDVVWNATEGCLARGETSVRVAYVDAVTTHLRCGDSESEEDSQSGIRFLATIHVAIFDALKKQDLVPTDYAALWKLLWSLVKRFEGREVVNGLPMLWRLMEIVPQDAEVERRNCVEGIYLAFVSLVADLFNVTTLNSVVTTEIETRTELNIWPTFIDLTAHKIDLAIEATFPTSTPRALPEDLLRTTIANDLTFSPSFPQPLREYLLLLWSEDSLPEPRPPLRSPPRLTLDYRTPESEYGPRATESQVTDSHTTSMNSFSVDDLHRKRSLSRYVERTSSPVTTIKQLRNVLEGENAPIPTEVPILEVNGEKIPSEDHTPVEEVPGEMEDGDVTSILESLNVNGEWKEKESGEIHPGDETLHPPYNGI